MLEDGIGDTIRVSLTEDPELEIPVCRNIVKRYSVRQIPNMRDLANPQSRSYKLENHSEYQIGNLLKNEKEIKTAESSKSLSLGEEFRERSKKETFEIANIGKNHVPIVIADLHKLKKISPENLEPIGYKYDVVTDKWNISDVAADYIFTADNVVDFALPGTLKIVCYYDTWINSKDKEKHFPIFEDKQYLNEEVIKSTSINFVMLDCYTEEYPAIDKKIFTKIRNDRTAVICLSSTNKNAVQSIRRKFLELEEREINNPIVIIVDGFSEEMDENLIQYAIEAGALLLDGFGDGICLGHRFAEKNIPTDHFLLNSIAFGILQATRTRISKTEYISCPSCGRTLFDLQETTAKIRAVTNHLKGVKIAIMGCIVNGPGEMADADFGYVGSGPGKITLYKGKEVVKRSVSEDVAVSELISLIKENDAWVEPAS